MRFIAALISLCFFACGSEEDDKPADCAVGTSPEVDIFTLKESITGQAVDAEATWLGSGATCVSAIVAAFAYQEGSEAPATCKDGTVEISTYKSAYITGLKPATTYSFRACVYRDADGYMSTGKANTITTRSE